MADPLNFVEEIDAEDLAIIDQIVDRTARNVAKRFYILGRAAGRVQGHDKACALVEKHLGPLSPAARFLSGRKLNG